MTLDFARFDARKYPTVGVEAGYDEWADTYEAVVRDEMDVRLLERVASVRWGDVPCAVDLGCGTGRIGAWLVGRGVGRVDGVDLSRAMLEQARARGVYGTLTHGDLRHTGLPDAACPLVTVSLVDEHLPELAPLYAEATRLLTPGGAIVLVGYHPQFMVHHGMPTHFHRGDGAPVAIETHVHLLSDHVAAAGRSGLTLVEMHEGLIDDAYVAAKPKWKRYAGTPVSFAFVWRRADD